MPKQSKTPAVGERGDLSQNVETGETRFSTQNSSIYRTDRKLVRHFLASFGRRSPTLAFLCHQTRMFYTKRYFTPHRAAWAAQWWCDTMGRSVYFVGNSHRMEEVRKPSKVDIELCVGIWLDVDNGGWDEDVPWALRSLINHDPAYIAYTGGGYQAHWRFETPTEDRADTEAINIWLRDKAIAADIPGVDKACWTCDHVWRLPGTRNRKPERNDSFVVLVHEDWESRLPLADCERTDAPASSEAPQVSFETEGFTLDLVQECLNERAYRMLTQRPSRCPTRSEHEFAFIAAVLGERDPLYQADIDLVAACMLAKPVDEFSVSHRAYSRRDPEDHVRRQIGDWLSKNGRVVT